jgi:hypothetical protein
MLMGGKARQWATRNPRHTHLLKMQGHNLTFCHMQSPWILLYFNDELLNNTVIETNRYVRHKIVELQISPWSIWSRWSDVSVPVVKSFLGLIINIGLIPLPNNRLLV